MMYWDLLTESSLNSQKNFLQIYWLNEIPTTPIREKEVRFLFVTHKRLKQNFKEKKIFVLKRLFDFILSSLKMYTYLLCELLINYLVYSMKIVNKLNSFSLRIE